MKLEELTDDAIDYILAHVDPDEMNHWEDSFVESVRDRWERERTLSERQREKLGEIWDRQT